jgi:Na+-transporting methylmalonyl-CoA/oxaloacetate decarboxylase gamma subunit
VSMKTLFYTFLFIIIYAAYSVAATITLAWDYPMPTPEGVKGFRIYFGTTSHAAATNPVDMTTAEPYDQRAELADPDARELAIPIETPGVYYFRMTSYGESVGSAFSGEVEAAVGLGIPTNLHIKSMTITFGSSDK